MNSSPNVILAIAPGKREFGVAVFINAELVYSSVKTIKYCNSDHFLFAEIAKIFQGLFEGFSITTVVVKALSQYQKLSSDLERVVERVKFESAKKSVPVAEITLEQIKSVLCENDRQTQKSAFEKLLKCYPELKRYWVRPNKWQNDYYAFLFSAVAAGTVYLKTRSLNN